jgi:hypothetical protein
MVAHPEVRAIQEEHERVTYLGLGDPPPQDSPAWLEPANQRWRDHLATLDTLNIPGHVLSELLQNAEDAAAEAQELVDVRVELHDDSFTFWHSGRDFTSQEFRRLCSTGAGTKKRTWRIGQFGHGFRTTFSLGDRVRVRSPKYSVEFLAPRHVYPRWVEDPLDRGIEVQVSLTRPGARAKLSESLERWATSPRSLLFFSHVRSITIGDVCWRRTTVGPGPIPGSEVVRLERSEQSFDFTVIHDELQVSIAFRVDPSLSLEAMNMELDRVKRPLLSPEGTIPITIAIPRNSDVSSQTLFAFLPTHPHADLPFLVNAPFIQSRTRTEIEPPEDNRFNRAVLIVAGHMAARGLERWLNSQEDRAGRVDAYRLVVAATNETESIEGLVSAGFQSVIADRGGPWVLKPDGEIAAGSRGVYMPPEIAGIWDERLVPAILQFPKLQEQPLLTATVKPETARRLEQAKWIERTTLPDLLRHLEGLQSILAPPSDDGYGRLVQLAEGMDPARFPILRAGHRLLSARIAIRDLDLAEWRTRNLDDAMAALPFPLVVSGSSSPAKFPTAAAAKAKKLKPDVLRAIADAAVATSTMAALIRCAWVASETQTAVDEEFPFLVRSGEIRRPKNGIIGELAIEIAQLNPPEMKESLHPEYAKGAPPTWPAWIASPASGLLSLPLLEACTITYELDGWPALREWFARHGCRGGVAAKSYRNPATLRTTKDWQWPTWMMAALRSPLASALVLHINRAANWSYLEAKVRSGPAWIAGQGGGHIDSIAGGIVTANWLVRLQNEACLASAAGTWSHPADLTMYPGARQELLATLGAPDELLTDDGTLTRDVVLALGVRVLQLEARGIMDAIRRNAEAAAPRTAALVDAWTLLDQQSLDAFGLRAELRALAANTPCIPGSDGKVHLAGDIVVQDTRGLPNLSTVHGALTGLKVWAVLEIPNEASVDLLVNHLARHTLGARLSGEDLERARATIRLAATECWSRGLWLSVGGHVMQPATARWTATTESERQDAGRLFEQYQRQVLDLTIHDSKSATILCEQPRLASVLLWRAEVPAGVVHEGLTRLVEALDWASQRLPAQLHQGRLRETTLGLGVVLHTTGIASHPVLDGQKAGGPTPRDHFWKEDVLHVRGRDLHEARRGFMAGILERGGQRVVDMARDCFDRNPEWIADYMKRELGAIPGERHPAPLPESLGTAHEATEDASSSGNDEVPETLVRLKSADELEPLEREPTPWQGPRERPDGPQVNPPEPPGPPGPAGRPMRKEDKWALEERGRDYVVRALAATHRVRKMDELQEGFDVLAVDNVTQQEIRIEVKAHLGDEWSVSLSKRQRQEMMDCNGKEGLRWELWNVVNLGADAGKPAHKAYTWIPKELFDEPQQWRVNLRKLVPLPERLEQGES